METNAVLKPLRWGGTATRKIAGAGGRDDRRFVLARFFLLALLLPICFQGCAVPRLGPRPSATRDHAFIKYWPAGGEGKLRLAIKDNIDMKGEVTTAGSQYVAGRNRPAVRDASSLGRARRGNVHIVGKTNLSEFALGTSGMNEYYGTPVNPLANHRIPGGSSSGSAVAVASGAADVAFGTDTAGSVRVPAACCGILGLKTTFGLVPLDGVFPISPAHLDTIGPMAKDVPRLVQGMELLNPGFSGRYKAATASARQLTVGRLYLTGTDRRIDRAIDNALNAKGFRVIALDDRFKAAWNEAQTNGATVAIADGYLSNHKYLGKIGVTLTTQSAIQLGQFQVSTTYKAALRARPKWRQTLRNVFEQVDFIALPTMQILAPRKPLFGRSAFFEARVLALQNTVAVNYAGNPAIAIPIPLRGRGLPLTSLQLVGPNLSEARLVNAARLLASEPVPTLENER